MIQLIYILALLLANLIASAQSAVLTTAHSDKSIAYGVGGIFPRVKCWLGL